MAQLVIEDAKKRGFATSFVVVSENDLHFHKFDELYRKVVQGLSTPACETGALGDILDRWIGGIEEHLIKLGVSVDAPDFDAKVLSKLDERLQALPGGSAPADMIRVVRKIFELKQASQPQDAAGLVSWLSGSENVAARLKKLADVKGEITSGDAMAYLRGILEITKSAGYTGLVIVIDEAETILRMRGDVRKSSMNAIRQIVDAAESYRGLLWLFTGTPTFFDDRHGVKGTEALHSRIAYNEFNGVPSLRQPQLALKTFDRDRLIKVALKLRSLHPDLAPELIESRLPRVYVEQLVDEVTKGFKGDVGVVPRQFLRRFVDLLDILADEPEREVKDLLAFAPKELSAEEEAVMAGRKLEAPTPDDEFSGSTLDM
jgi:hypothetical protein